MSAPESMPRHPDSPSVEIRALTSHTDFQACVELQRATWGGEYEDVVPASLLKVTSRVGGVVAGAFGPGGELAGFVYGITGIRRGEPIHWSHMLAVVPDWRKQGLGRLLKSHQAREVLSRGIQSLLWTFDPLVARNAHFNLTLLGVEVEEYVEEMYGATGSRLHSFGTDRFVVRWRPQQAMAHERGTRQAEGETGRLPDPLPTLSRRVAIPRDVEGLAGREPTEALRWRLETRSQFTSLLAQGYRVAGFDPGTPGADPAYLLEPR